MAIKQVLAKVDSSPPVHLKAATPTLTVTVTCTLAIVLPLSVPVFLLGLLLAWMEGAVMWKCDSHSAPSAIGECQYLK